MSVSGMSLNSFELACRESRDIRGLKSGRQFIAEARAQALALTRPFQLLTVVVLALAILLLTACCPITLRPELVHVSHISQHFGSHSGNLGYDAAMLDLHLEPVKHLQIDIADGMILEHPFVSQGVELSGALEGPREVFSATIGWDIVVRK